MRLLEQWLNKRVTARGGVLVVYMPLYSQKRQLVQRSDIGLLVSGQQFCRELLGSATPWRKAERLFALMRISGLGSGIVWDTVFTLG